MGLLVDRSIDCEGQRWTNIIPVDASLDGGHEQLRSTNGPNIDRVACPSFAVDVLDAGFDFVGVANAVAVGCSIAAIVEADF